MRSGSGSCGRSEPIAPVLGRPRSAPRRTLSWGFTLLELIIVIAVIGILATIALPSLRDLPRKAHEATLKTNLRTMRDVIDQYHGDKGHYPPTLGALVETAYLRAVPRDPITRSSETWTLVFEEIDPEALPAETAVPEEGQPGIVDVHSGAAETSLSGEPYSEW